MLLGWPSVIKKITYVFHGLVGKKHETFGWHFEQYALSHQGWWYFWSGQSHRNEWAADLCLSGRSDKKKANHQACPSTEKFLLCQMANPSLIPALLIYLDQSKCYCISEVISQHERLNDGKALENSENTLTVILTLSPRSKWSRDMMAPKRIPGKLMGSRVIWPVLTLQACSHLRP